MSEIGEKLTRFVHELQRRKTIRVSAAYIGVGLVLIAVASDVLTPFQTPDWVLRAVIIAVIVGLPIAIVLSWIFDITPEGLIRTDGEHEAPDQATSAQVEEEVVVEEVKPSVAIALGSAQRRQVSLLRCTVGLTEQGMRVNDPEVLRAAIPELDRLFDRIALRFSGYRLDSGGSAFELLFGYPVAFENDAVRAVAAAFAIVRDARNLPLGIPGHSDLAIDATIGVDSDLVIIEETDDEASTARVVGSTSETAAWLQSLGPVGTIALSEDTFALLGNTIRCESLGEHTNARTGAASTAYRALELLSPKDALEAHGSILQKVYGRDSEIALIMDRWELAQDGEDQFIVLRGEPGIGKSTLIRKIIAKAKEDESALIMPMYCSPFERSNAFHPIIEFMFGSGLGLESAESDSQRASRVANLLQASGLDADRSAPLMATLLKFGDMHQTGDDRAPSGEALRKEMLNCLVELFHSAARRGRLLVIFEDIHWADPSTLEFIDMIVNSGSEAGSLCLFTSRPSLNLDWESRSDVTVLDLQRLPRRVTENLIKDILGEVELPGDIIEKILSETGGNPLFVEELTKAVAESADDTMSETSTGLVLPGTLQQSLASRIDRVGTAKPLLQLCSLLWRRFDYELLRAVSHTENEQALQEDLRTIVNAGFLFQEGAIPDSSYRFKHILMQESAQSSLLKSTRVQLHGHIAEILENQFPERTKRQPELLAYHYGEGDEPGKAVMYWAQACKNSLGAYAIRESIEQAESGLHALTAMPESASRDTAEITLRSLHGKGLLTLRGYADPIVEETFGCALTLSESIGQSPELFQIIVGLWMYFFIGQEAEHALALSRRLKRIAQTDPTPARILQAHYCHGYSLYRLGRYADSLSEFEQALIGENAKDDFTSESASGDDTRIHVRCILAHVLWHLGHVQRSLRLLDDARQLAAKLGNPYGVVFATFVSCWMHALRCEPEAAQRYAEDTIAVAEERGFRFFVPLGKFMKAWASFDGGRSASGVDAANRIDTMEACLKVYTDAGATNGATWFMLQIAEDRVNIGESDAAELQIERARKYIEDTGERFFESEVLRLSGLVAGARGDDRQAEELLVAAAEMAREAGSISLALRATLNLAELLRNRGDVGKATELISTATASMPEQDEVRESVA